MNRINQLLKYNTMLSPLAGYTDAGFRLLAHQYNVGLTVTEMVSAKALTMNHKVTRDMLYCCEQESPKSVQLFGSQPTVFAQVVDSGVLDAFDIIDINMGCPMPKIVNNGEGSALMAQPSIAQSIVRAVKGSGKIVSVKFRSGITDDCLAVDFARRLEQAGADMLTIHARNAKQMYQGKADWQVITDVVRAVKIPVFGNGDVVDECSFHSMLDRTGCYGVAIGRGALGRPYIFSQILGIPYTYDILSAINIHCESLLTFMPRHVVVNEMKKHISYYLKGIKGNKDVKDRVQQSQDIDLTLLIVSDFLNQQTN
ncbi:MAG: tRNA-dihydrouridine synthase family protein [Clostridia bacterium]|nr:tRNA-dihydrouridine synthase family protein [Clostridia bacterium]